MRTPYKQLQACGLCCQPNLYVLTGHVCFRALCTTEAPLVALPTMQWLRDWAAVQCTVFLHSSLHSVRSAGSLHSRTVVLHVHMLVLQACRYASVYFPTVCLLWCTHSGPASSEGALVDCSDVRPTAFPLPPPCAF